MKRFVRWLTRPIPVNSATIGFAFLEGATLSAPTAIWLTAIRPFEPPKLLADICGGIAMDAAFVLPFWCWFVLKKVHQGLATFGLVTFVVFVLWGLLTPAL